MGAGRGTRSPFVTLNHLKNLKWSIGSGKLPADRLEGMLNSKIYFAKADQRFLPWG